MADEVTKVAVKAAEDRAAIMTDGCALVLAAFLAILCGVAYVLFAFGWRIMHS